MTSICVLSGGVGAARMLAALSAARDPATITAIVNTADDMTLHGLAISPDLDTVTYTLADAINPETGWGLVDESWNALDALGRFGGQTWFALGDKDLATHLYRTQRLNDGATLTEVTAEIAAAFGVRVRLLPMSDDPVRTFVTTVDGSELEFQRWFVERQHQDPIASVRFDGAETAQPGPDVLNQISSTDVLIIAPSNPFVSIAPILAVPGVDEAVRDRRANTVAISPIIGGAALKGPAADLLATLGHEVSAVGVAEVLAPYAAHLIIDVKDEALCDRIRAIGVTPHVTRTIMSEPGVAVPLAELAISAAGGGA